MFHVYYKSRFMLLGGFLFLFLVCLILYSIITVILVYTVQTQCGNSIYLLFLLEPSLTKSCEVKRPTPINGEM